MMRLERPFAVERRRGMDPVTKQVLCLKPTGKPRPHPWDLRLQSGVRDGCIVPCRKI